MSDYDITLPFPPSVNGYWRTVNNRQIISKRGREYRELAIQYIEGAALYNEKLPYRLAVSVTLNPPTLRRFDIDNFVKAPFDALTHAGFWLDDEQIDVLTIRKGEKVKGGNVKIKVEILK